jgi:hypothetical protein
MLSTVPYLVRGLQLSVYIYFGGENGCYYVDVKPAMGIMGMFLFGQDKQTLEISSSVSYFYFHLVFL